MRQSFQYLRCKYRPGGHRYSKEEKDTLRKAVQSYADQHGLDQENLDWLFCTKSTGKKHKQGGPWQVISRALPNRTMASVWSCGTRMLHVNNYKVVSTPGSFLRRLGA